jgi:hypothetical protein
VVKLPAHRAGLPGKVCRSYGAPWLYKGGQGARSGKAHRNAWSDNRSLTFEESRN